MKHLIVTNPFGDYQRGDRITDTGKVSETLGSHHAADVVQIDVADPPAPPAPAGKRGSDSAT